MFKDESEFEKVVDRLKIDTKPNPMHRENLRREMLASFNEQSSARVVVFRTLRRTIMKSPATKIAAAAAIILAVLIGFHSVVGSAPAFAEVVQPLLSARTATFKMTFDMEGSPHETFDCMVMEPGRTREERPGGVIRILDHTEGRTTMLYPARKKAVIFEKTDIPQGKQKDTNWLHEIREWIRQAQQTEDESVKFIGKRQIDGVEAFGYRIRLGEVTRMAHRIIWANSETLVPIRIEYSIADGSSMGVKGTITYSNFILNVAMDESLFVVPEGYDIDTIAFDTSKTNEEDLIQALRIWAENTDSQFPSELNIRAAGRLFEAVKEKMGLTSKENRTPDFTKPQFPEFFVIRQKIIRGLGFKSKLPSESDWHYVGKNVKFGKVEKPIFWYRPEGSETYRVIYGDLSVKDVAPENLPQ